MILKGQDLRLWTEKLYKAIAPLSGFYLRDSLSFFCISRVVPSGLLLRIFSSETLLV